MILGMSDIGKIVVLKKEIPDEKIGGDRFAPQNETQHIRGYVRVTGIR